MFLGSVSNTAMEKAMSGLWQRQRIINHNIANEDTPGYKAKRLDFETTLRRELNSLRGEGLSARESISRLRKVQPEEYELEGINGRIDENSVDLDSEYIEMARTQIQYNALEARVNGYYTNMKYIISGGR